MTCTVLLKKIIQLSSGPTLDHHHIQEKAPETNQRKKERGDATFLPHPSSLNMERKPRVAGGSKWTYEATFHITVQIGREYYTTAAKEHSHTYSLSMIWTIYDCYKKVLPNKILLLKIVTNSSSGFV